MESYGILALLPAAIVITLALVTKKTHLSLVIGIFVGVVILCGGNPLTAFPIMFRDYIIPPLTSESNIRTLIIIVVIQGMAKMLRITGAGPVSYTHLGKHMRIDQRRSGTRNTERQTLPQRRRHSQS